MHVTLTHPYVHVGPSGQAAYVSAEEQVWIEEDLPFGRDGIDDFHCIPGRAAIITFRLHLGCRVHVRHHDRARMFRLPVAQLSSSDRLGEGASGPEVRE